MQSTVLALVPCENANAAQQGLTHSYPLVPAYDLVVFCDLGFEPPWACSRLSLFATPVKMPIFGMICCIRR